LIQMCAFKATHKQQDQVGLQEDLKDMEE